MNTSCSPRRYSPVQGIRDKNKRVPTTGRKKKPARVKRRQLFQLSLRWKGSGKCVCTPVVTEPSRETRSSWGNWQTVHFVPIIELASNCLTYLFIFFFQGKNALRFWTIPASFSIRERKESRQSNGGMKWGILLSPRAVMKVVSL